MKTLSDQIASLEISLREVESDMRGVSKNLSFYQTLANRKSAIEARIAELELKRLPITPYEAPKNSQPILGTA